MSAADDAAAAAAAVSEAEDALRCCICHERYDAPVLLAKCGHQFCANCIRRALQFREECPACRMPAKAHDIVPARPFAALAAACARLVSLVSGGREPDAKRARRVCDACGVAVAADCMALHAEECLATDATREEFNRRAHAKLQAKKTSSAAAAAVQSTEEECRPTKRIPPVVYALLSEKALRGKCRELGLNCRGNKAALERRHREYTVLHNAECDAERPRTVKELLAQVAALDDAIDAQARLQQKKQQQPRDGSSDAAAFARLVSEVRSRGSCASANL